MCESSLVLRRCAVLMNIAARKKICDILPEDDWVSYVRYRFDAPPAGILAVFDAIFQGLREAWVKRGGNRSSSKMKTIGRGRQFLLRSVFARSDN